MGKLKTLFSSWNGRIGRGQFWLGVLLIFVATFAISGLFMLAGQGVSNTTSGTVQVDGGAAMPFSNTKITLNAGASLTVSLIGSFLMLTIGIKRRHDRDFAGWDIAAFLVLSLFSQVLGMLGRLDGPLGVTLGVVLFVWGICLFILMGCLKGTTGPNRYGPDPLARTS